MLRAQVQRYLDAAAPSGTTRVRAVIAPHAGYVCSGQVAGRSFGALCTLPEATYTVFLIGPAHWVPVDGIALSSADAFATPLGNVPVDGSLNEALLAQGAPFYVDDAAHEPEHALEVELPFLQTALPRLRIVPLLVQDAQWSVELSAALCPFLQHDKTTLVAVSSDLSHYRSDADARTCDQALLRAVAAGDIDRARRGEACGLPAILALMHMAAHCGWMATILGYANAGETCGDRRSVIGYGAMVFND